MRVVIIGTGNTATVLGRLINQNGHMIVQVFGRSIDSAKDLAAQLNANAIDDLNKIDKSADIFILAVSDKAIIELAAKVKIEKGILVHTAGSVKMDLLKNSSRNYGILYPLQSLRKEMKDLPAIPLLVDGNTPDDITLLVDFAKTLSSQVQTANDEQRLNLHMTAILVNNFPNYLYAKAEDFCRKHQVDFHLLLPLIQQTSNRLFLQPPKETQTGPAIRGDEETINKHLALLQDEPELKNLYMLFTEYIQAYFK